MEKPTILIADPRDAERKLLAYLLDHEGYVVHESRSGTDTIRAAQSNDVDLIILHTSLWRCTETNALVTLKHHPRTKTIPVMLYGQPRDKEDLVRGVLSGATEWVVQNGFSTDKLLSKLATVLNSAGQAEPEPNQVEAATKTAEPPSSELGKLTPEQLREVLETVHQVPVYEFNIVDTITTTCRKDQTEDHLAEIALRDPMMLLALLARANGKLDENDPETITDAQRAVHAVGAKGFYELAESLKPSNLPSNSQWNPAQFWAHSVATARIAEMLSARLQLGTPSEARCLGLLHDIGLSILAHEFPQHMEGLLAAARAGNGGLETWEDSVIGARHGEIARWAARQFRLPSMIADVVVAHHGAMASRRALRISARVLALVVQAADQIADALFPGDMPLTPLNRLTDEFHAAWKHTHAAPEELITDARRIVAELTTEMAHRFPGATESQYYYRHKPLSSLVYTAPGHHKLDLIQTFFEVRTSALQVLERVGERPANKTAPIVVNLAHLPDLSGQVEALTSLMAAGVMKGRRGILMVSGELNPVHRNFVAGDWRAVTLPTHPAGWMVWLSEAARTAETAGAAVETPAGQPAAA